MTKVGLLVAGLKGLNFLSRIYEHCDVVFVSSYAVQGTLDGALDQIESFCRERDLVFIDRKNLKKEIFHKPNVDLVFIVGWQHLIDVVDERFVVFHDSLLPKYRGFAPTVTALIRGDNMLGVTALKPSKEADTGPIYGQVAVEIEYPMKIKNALSLLSDCYFKLAKDILIRFKNGPLSLVNQDESKRTYSIWLDEWDYYIDWNWPSEKIARFIDAVGWPYEGAQTFYQSKVIIIEEAAKSEDILFEIRSPGKIWSLIDGKPEIVCGSGMLRIMSARYRNGEKVVFTKLRERLGFIPYTGISHKLK